MFGCFFNVKLGCVLLGGPFNSFKITIMKTNHSKPWYVQSPKFTLKTGAKLSRCFEGNEVSVWSHSY